MKLACRSCFNDRLTETRPGDDTDLCQISKILTDFVENPLADFNNQVCFFSNWDEIGRKNKTSLGQFPAYQCLGPKNLASDQIVLGLVVNQQLVSFERAL